MRVALGGALLAVLALLASAALAGAATTLHASLSGKKEVPKAGNGKGTARLTLDAKKGRVCFRIKLKHVGTVMAGHIHKGGKKTAGPIVVPLFATPTKQPKGCTQREQGHDPGDRQEARRLLRERPHREVPGRRGARPAALSEAGAGRPRPMRLAPTSDLWWKNAVVYCLDVETSTRRRSTA